MGWGKNNGGKKLKYEKRFCSKSSWHSTCGIYGSTTVGSIDLYLQCGKETYYRIGYKLEGGTLKNPVNAYTGASAVKLPKPTKPGYKFTGWKATYVVDSVKVTTKGVNTTIRKGSKGDIYFTASYAPLK